MTLDSRLRSAVEDTQSRISGLQPSPIRRRSRRIPTAGWVAVAAAFVVVIVITWPRLETDQHFVAGVASGETLLSEDPLVVRGAPGPTPQFDTAQLGTEIQLMEVNDIDVIVSRIEQTDFADKGEVFKVIVAGAMDTGATAGIVFFPTTPGTNGELEWCLWIVPSYGDRSSCSGAPGRAIGEDPVLGMYPDTDKPDSATWRLGTLAWGPAPGNTSVVTLTYGDTSLWQKPVGGVALFHVDIPVGDEMVLTALDQNGNTIYTETHVGSPPD